MGEVDQQYGAALSRYRFDIFSTSRWSIPVTGEVSRGGTQRLFSFRISSRPESMPGALSQAPTVSLQGCTFGGVHPGGACNECNQRNECDQSDQPIGPWRGSAPLEDSGRGVAIWAAVAAPRTR